MVYIKAETAEMQMKSEAMAANVLIIASLEQAPV
jgi:hypothetical protein